MITLGIDLSSMPEGTAACRIRWMRNRAVAELPVLRCDDDELDRLIKEADVVGIDAPFGWPEEFVMGVAGWKRTVWSKEERRRLQFRVTDLYVQEKTKLWTLSVSTDRIALPAMRAMALLQRHNVKDRSGGFLLRTTSRKTQAVIGSEFTSKAASRFACRRTPKFYEVYPAASLKVWDLPCRGYKLLDPECGRVRRKILSQLRKKLPWLEVGDEYLETSDSLDALIASLTARVAARGLTMRPERGQVTNARREGWIHLPKELPAL